MIITSVGERERMVNYSYANDVVIITSVGERARMVNYSYIPFNFYGNGTKGALAVTQISLS